MKLRRFAWVMTGLLVFGTATAQYETTPPKYLYKGKSPDDTHVVAKGKVVKDSDGCWIGTKSGQTWRFKSAKDAKRVKDWMNRFLNGEASPESGTGALKVRKLELLNKFELVGPDGKVYGSFWSEEEANEMAKILSRHPPIMGPCK
jgi:hypothetical protein